MNKDQFEEKLDIVFCRKCNVPMKKVTRPIQTIEGNRHEWPYHCIPQLELDPPIAKINSVLPVEVFVCEKCRLVELYSAGRKGAES